MVRRATCWQCGRVHVSDWPGETRGDFEATLKQMGWYLYSRSMRFCRACSASAKLALGVIVVDAGKTC